MKKLIWEFYGPDSNMFALHHSKHLKEFAEREKIPNSMAGIDRKEGGQHDAWMTLPKENAEIVIQTLRPRKVEDL